MPFAITPLGKSKDPTPEAPTIYSKSYRHSIVDSTYQPEMSLLSQVEGAPRLVQYFRGFLGESEEPKPFGVITAPTYQSYTQIDGVVIKQEGGGSFNFNPETTESLQTYTGWVTFDVAPIIHDIFIVDIGDGNAGLCAITQQPEIRNFTANKVYYITYELKGILTEEIFTEISSRVVEERVYSKDSVLHGGHSLITKGESETGQKLFQWSGTIANWILRTWYWNPERTIVFDRNDSDDKVYDPYLVNFLCAVIPPDWRTNYPHINQFSVQYGGLEHGRWGTINIWEVLLRGDFNLLQMCNRKAALMEVTRLMNTRLYGNLRSSKIRWVVVTNPEDYLKYKVYFNMDGFPILQPGKEDPIPEYMFSASFYDGAPVGEFESLVFDILKNKLVDHKRLLEYCEGYFKLTEREQLYHGAILLLLLQLARAFRGPL